MLSFIKNINQFKNALIDYYELYRNAFFKAMTESIEQEHSPQNLMKNVFCGIKFCANEGITEITDYEVVENIFTLMEFVKSMIKELTPNQLMQIFPVDKVYDGERWGVKDYYSTMESLNQHGLDTPIGESVDDILWDYMNRDIKDFQCNLLWIINRVYRANIGGDIVKEWADSVGIPTYRKHTDSITGKEYMIDSNGKTKPLKKPRPRHLKLI